jgi:CMP-N-acetylneuraminic acid synthetase
MNIFALQTARDGSKSVLNKNLLTINGKQLYQHNVDFACSSQLIKRVYISTDIDEIINKHQNSDKIEIIRRPKYLCTATSPHHHAIMHGLTFIEKHNKCSVDILVILLGNNMGAYPTHLNNAINILTNNDQIDSCISVNKLNMFNPYRAFRINHHDYLETHMDQKAIKLSTRKNHNDKNAYDDTYFFNGSFWACRRKAIIDNNGLLPFPWLGKKIKYIIQDDNVQELDAPWQIPVLKS